jgi:hypothetical protein
MPDKEEFREMVLEEALKQEKSGNPLPLDQVAAKIQLRRIAAGKDLISSMSPKDLKEQHPDLYAGIVKLYTEQIRSDNGASTPSASTPRKRDDSSEGRSGQKPRTRAEILAAIEARAGARKDDYD